jgi:PKD repeat protein
MRVLNLRKRLVRRRSSSLGSKPKGQSLPEFALTLPLFLFMVLIGLDFGRVYAGWVTLQQASRIAANWASVNPDAWGSPGKQLARDRYQKLILDETHGINCDLPNPAPDPTFPDGAVVGGRAVVTLNCQFQILTPLIAAVLPNPLQTTASSVFPIKVGFTNRSTCSQNGTCPTAPNVAIGSLPAQSPPPIITANSGQQIYFFPVQGSGGAPCSPTDFQICGSGYSWDFGDGTTSNDQNPIHSYTNGTIGTLTFTVSLNACNVGGCSYSSVIVHVLSPTPPPVAAFYWCNSGSSCSPQDPSPPPGNVTVQFTDTSTNMSGCASPTCWTWNFGDGASAICGGSDQTHVQNPCHNYAQVATTTVRTITLTATNAYGSSTATAQLTLSPPAPTCNAPYFTGPDPISTGKGLNKDKWTIADVSTYWNGVHTQGTPSHTVGGFTLAPSYPLGQPASGQFFTVTSQDPIAGSMNWDCATKGLALFWQ